MGKSTINHHFPVRKLLVITRPGIRFELPQKLQIFRPRGQDLGAFAQAAPHLDHLIRGSHQMTRQTPHTDVFPYDLPCSTSQN